MVKTIALFLLAFFVGLTLEATFIHGAFPALVGPDLILILVLYLAFHWRNTPGAVGAFILGVGEDFASARFIGPNAAGNVIAFLVVAALANRIYAEKGVASAVVAFLASVAKLGGLLLMLKIYINLPLSEVTLSTALIESTLTAVITPLILRFFSPSNTLLRSPAAADAYRRY